jgi:phosphomannomutase
LTLIKSISGIRGTIGGLPGNGLTPVDVVKFAASFASIITKNKENPTIIIGRDARISGPMVSALVVNTLRMQGIHVIDLGLSTTPTVEMAVPTLNAHGGIILTASHNPKQWNALKLLNEKGEFISAKEGQSVLDLAESGNFTFADVDVLGSYRELDFIDTHIQQVLALPLVNQQAITKSNFKVAIDCVNSTGGIALPRLLRALGVQNILELYTEPNGHFPHNPEPLPEHLTDLSELMRQSHADVGFVVDPDVDRLAILNEDGSMFGEEYTLVAVADYILKHQAGPTVSNLSSTRALKEVSDWYGMSYEAAAVGEVNVVEKMKAVGAVIGGEGNGGIIYPELHYGRDALVGIALFLSHLAEKGMKCSELRATYPAKFMSKNKIELTPDIDVDLVLTKMAQKHANQNISTIDGVKIDFPTEWVHLRKSNTEPIIRIYSESNTMQRADELAQEIIQQIKSII